MSNKNEKKEKNYDTSGIIMGIFTIITIVYFVLKYITLKDEKSQKAMIGILVTYLLLIAVSSLVINNAAIKDKCGEDNYGAAFLATLIPWGLIFGLLNLVLLIFPGWKAPFSNTFGYLIIRLAGISDILNNVIKTKAGKEDEKGVSEMIAKIYTDKSLLINEVTPTNFPEFWETMNKGKLLKKTANEYKQKLKSLIILKDMVSEFIWYLLTGTIITTLSSNYISSMKCTPSPEYLERKHKEWEDKNNSKKKAGKVYYSDE